MNGGGSQGSGLPDPLNVHTAKSRGGMGLPDPFGLFDSKDLPPEGPDYLSAATEQGRQNRLTALLNAQLSNPDVVNPIGRRDVQFGADTLTPEQMAAKGPRPTAEDEWARYDAAHQARFGSPVPRGPEQQGHVDAALQQRLQEWSGVSPNAVRIVETLNPDQQRLFDAQTRVSQNLMDIGEQGLGRVGESMAKPFSFGSADELQNRTEQALLSRLEPNFARDEDLLRTRLANQGITAQSNPAAFNQDIDALTRQRTDARMAAVLGGLQARPQALQEEAFLRGLPLNELNALRSGAQVQLPQFQQYQGSNAAPAPTFAATQAQSDYTTDLFNAQQAQQAQQNSTLGSLAVSAAMFF
jgi:hypothetical protein